MANKLPQGVNGSNGRAFIYADNTNPQWQLSSKLIDDEKSAIGATVSQIYKHEPVMFLQFSKLKLLLVDCNALYFFQSAFYMLYSDDGPARGSDSYRGHSKGAMLFDHSTGFWLSHSVPNYPPISTFTNRVAS